MTTKEKILLYFRDINYAYNDCTRLDSLEKALSGLEEVVRCEDCKYSDECNKRISYSRRDGPNMLLGSEPVEYCSRGDRKYVRRVTVRRMKHAKR